MPAFNIEVAGPGSTMKFNNGTYLNGDDIFQERPSLSDNDTVKVGTINLKLKLLE